MSKSKRFNSVRASIDVVDRESGIVLCHFNYRPFFPGDWENARDLAVRFVRDLCLRHHLELSSYRFVDHYHSSSWLLTSTLESDDLPF